MFFPSKNQPRKITKHMKTKLSLGVSLLSFFIGVSAVNASDSVRVQSSRSLRVVVIDHSKADATRAAVHDAFAASLSASLGRQGSALGVKTTTEANAEKAAAELSAGNYDAALVFENVLPAPFRTSEFASSRGLSEVGVPVRIFHLVLLKGDEAMVASLTSAFGDTLKATLFQDALSRSVAIRVVASSSR